MLWAEINSGLDKGARSANGALGFAPVIQSPTVGRAELSGIPLFWTEAAAPLRVALVFRVGQQDEPLHLRGATHLVEHLALNRVRGRPYAFNGHVESALTIFEMSGSPAEASDFLQIVNQGLVGRLSVEEVDVERKLLRAEANGRASFGTLRRLRYGAQHSGTAGFSELSLGWIRASHVEAWRDGWFTAQNAAVVMTGPPELQANLFLPGGTSRPEVPAVPRAMTTPAAYFAKTASIVLSLVAEPSFAVTTGAMLLHRRLFDRLRMARAISYSPSVTIDSVDRDHVEIVVAADCLPESAQSVIDEVVALVGALAQQPPPSSEVELVTSRLSVAPADSASALAMLTGLAHRHLNGLPFHDPAEQVAALRAVTGTEVSDAFSVALPTALMVVPRGTTAPPGIFRPYPSGNVTAAADLGKELRPARPGKQGVRLFLGETSITCFTPEGATRVDLKECAAACYWPRGELELIAAEGCEIQVEPADWSGGDQIWGRVRALVPEERIVPMFEVVATSAPVQSEVGPQCQVCGGRPAMTATFRSVSSYVWLWRRRVTRGAFCRSCALAVFRSETDRTLLLGWWHALGFFFTLHALLGNLAYRAAMRNLKPAPRVNGQLLPGNPVVYRPGFGVALLGIGVLGYVLAGGPLPRL